MNFVQNCWSCSCYPCVTNAQGCSSFTHRFDAQIAMHRLPAIASILLYANAGTLCSAIQHSRRRPRTACGAHRQIDFAARRGAPPRLVSPLCGYTSALARRDVWRQRRTRTSRIEPAVRRLRPQVALPGPNKALTAQPAALRSPRPAGAKRCR